MAGDVVNIKVCSPLKLRSGLTGKYHATSHYSYNLPLCGILKREKAPRTLSTFGFLPTQNANPKKTKRA
jgi:hypothetical protein